MRESVPSPRYSPVCNVLRQWKTSFIPTYRVYRLYDNYTEHRLKKVTLAFIYIYSNNYYDTKHTSLHGIYSSLLIVKNHVLLTTSYSHI